MKTEILISILASQEIDLDEYCTDRGGIGSHQPERASRWWNNHPLPGRREFEIIIPRYRRVSCAEKTSNARRIFQQQILYAKKYHKYKYTLLINMASVVLISRWYHVVLHWKYCVVTQLNFGFCRIVAKDNPADLWKLRYWFQFLQLRTWIHDNL